jgi:hypothetical protein
MGSKRLGFIAHSSITSGFTAAQSITSLLLHFYFAILLASGSRGKASGDIIIPKWLVRPRCWLPKLGAYPLTIAISLGYIQGYIILYKTYGM